MVVESAVRTLGGRVANDRFPPFASTRSAASSAPIARPSPLRTGSRHPISSTVLQHGEAGGFTGGGNNSEARVAGGRVLFDADGDGTADIFITLDGLTGAGQLSAADFAFT